MADSGSRWEAKEREEFWGHVRGLVAKRRLTHEDLARELDLDRSAVSRRIEGAVRQRPSRDEVERLASALRLTAEEATDLLARAGYAEPTAEGRQPNGASGEGTSNHGVPRWLVTVGVSFIVSLVVVLGILAAMSEPIGPRAKAVGTRVVQPAAPLSTGAGEPPSVPGEGVTASGLGTVAGWVVFRADAEHSSSAWVTIWYFDAEARRWNDRSLQVLAESRLANCTKYGPLANDPLSLGVCYEFTEVPMVDKVQVRVHYERNYVRDYFVDLASQASPYWIGTTFEE